MRRATYNRQGGIGKHATRAFQKTLISSAIVAATNLTMVSTGFAADDEMDILEEIIVTTERREQSLQSVAATVQVLSGEELQLLGVNSSFANLQYAIPGLQIANQEGKLEIFLRGIGSSDSDFSSDPSVAVHYNGVYLPRPRGIGPLFFDSQRVEVNKGPQGTLRGRNATGGTINIISNAPDFEEFGGYVQGGIGNFSSREFEGVLNIPLSDTLAVRLSAWHSKHDGLYTNAFLDDDAQDSFETPSSQDDVAGRVSIRWQPTENFTADLQYFQADVNSSGDPGTFGGRSQSAGFDVDDLDDAWDQYFRTEGNYEQDVKTFIAKLVYDFDGFGVEYNGSWNKLNAYNQNASREWQLGFNFPGSEAEADFIASGANPQRNLLVNDTFYQADRSKSIIQEVRFFSNDDGPLTWTAGGFYFHEDFDFLSWDVGNGFCGNSNFFNREAPLGPDTVSCWQNGLGGENRGDDSEVESLAFYGDATYEVSDRLRVKAGLRWTRDEKTQNDFNAQYQFTFNQDFLLGFPGIATPSDLIIGEQGFRLTLPAERSNTEFGPGSSGLDLFQDGIQSYGLGDNWGAVLDACTEGVNCEVAVTSVFGETLRATSSVENKYVDWRVGAEYDIGEDSMIYATVSTGTRSGGINRPITLADGTQLARTWDPEELLVFEIGSKNTFVVGENPVRLNAAAFYYDYDDYVAQLLVDVPNPTPTNPNATTQQVQTDNVSNAEVYGLEVDGNIDLPAGFNVNLNVSYLDSSFKDSAILDPRTNGNLVVNVDGNELPNISHWNINLRVHQRIEVNWQSVSSFDWTVNTLYRSQFFLSAFNNKGYALDANGNTVEIPLADLPAPNNNGALSNVGGAANANFFSDVQDAFFIVNVNAGLNFGDEEQFRLDFYANNLFRQAFSPKAFVNSSVNIRYLNAPRQLGVRFKARF